MEFGFGSKGVYWYLSQLARLFSSGFCHDEGFIMSSVWRLELRELWREGWFRDRWARSNLRLEAGDSTLLDFDTAEENRQLMDFHGSIDC